MPDTESKRDTLKSRLPIVGLKATANLLDITPSCR